MRILIIVLISVVTVVILMATIFFKVGGLGMWHRQEAHWAGHANVCVDHVTYLQFSSGATIKRDINDKLVPC